MATGPNPNPKARRMSQHTACTCVDLLRTAVCSGHSHTPTPDLSSTPLCWNLLLPISIHALPFSALLCAPGSWSIGQHQWAALSFVLQLDQTTREQGRRAEGRRPARHQFLLPAPTPRLSGLKVAAPYGASPHTSHVLTPSHTLTPSFLSAPIPVIMLPLVPSPSTKVSLPLSSSYLYKSSLYETSSNFPV